MFFELSKLAWLAIEPFSIFIILLLAATIFGWAGRNSVSRYFLTFCTVFLLAIVIFPIGDALLLDLEQRFRPPQSMPGRVDGIILLGGAQNSLLTKHYNQPVLNDAAERMTTFLALARKYPNARLVFSGGSGDIRHQELSETDTVKLFLEQQGFSPDRLLYEAKSRNTYENAIFSKALVKPDKEETWLLVTSAAHMPRSVGIFRKIGWPVIPFPCDYRAQPDLILFPHMRLTDSLVRLEDGLHEWLGLAVYFVTGKTDSLFPKPDDV